VTPADAARRARQFVRSRNPRVRLFVRTFQERIARGQAIMSAASHGATALGTLALMLAVIGLYGVMTWLVVQRTREIGIRMALGAQAHNVLVLVLAQGMKLVVLGAIIGIPASTAAARVLSSLLIGLKRTDALTIGAVTALLVAVTLLACYLPARRATRVDPLVTQIRVNQSLFFGPKIFDRAANLGGVRSFRIQHDIFIQFVGCAAVLFVVPVNPAEVLVCEGYSIIAVLD
jgi:ABC-type lipoprotein release transport system permease subunit